MGQGQYLNGRKILMTGREILPFGDASWLKWLLRRHHIELKDLRGRCFGGLPVSENIRKCSAQNKR